MRYVVCENLFDIWYVITGSNLIQFESDRGDGIRGLLIICGCRTARDRIVCSGRSSVRDMLQLSRKTLVLVDKFGPGPWG